MYFISDTLDVSSTGATLSATEVWGALRGLETFSQLVQQAKTGEVSTNRVLDKLLALCMLDKNYSRQHFETFFLFFLENMI